MTGEAYGSDAVVPLAAIAARTDRIRLGTGIMQMPARTPPMTAMYRGDDGRGVGRPFLLGLGLSGPQVVEGWHGRPYTPPLQTTASTSPRSARSCGASVSSSTAT